MTRTNMQNQICKCGAVFNTNVGPVQCKCAPRSIQMLALFNTMCALFNANVCPVQYNVCPVQYKCWSRSSWTAQYLSVTVTVRDTGNMQK